MVAAMRCVMCKPLMKMIGKLSPSGAATVRDFEDKAFKWHLSHCNTKTIWQKECDLAAVSQANELLKSDPQNGRLQLQDLAENGSVWSMLLLGWCYQAGSAGTVDYEKAIHWYQLASGADCDQAQLRLARLYLHRKDFDCCADMIADWRNRRWSPATYYVAFAKLMQPRTTTRLNEARELFERSAMRGDVKAQGWLAMLYLQGAFGFKLSMYGFKSLRIFMKNADATIKDQPLIPWKIESSGQMGVTDEAASPINPEER